jgi:hypothetical protein
MLPIKKRVTAINFSTFFSFSSSAPQNYFSRMRVVIILLLILVLIKAHNPHENPFRRRITGSDYEMETRVSDFEDSDESRRFLDLLKQRHDHQHPFLPMAKEKREDEKKPERDRYLENYIHKSTQKGFKDHLFEEVDKEEEEPAPKKIFPSAVFKSLLPKSEEKIQSMEKPAIIPNKEHDIPVESKEHMIYQTGSVNSANKDYKAIFKTNVTNLNEFFNTPVDNWYDFETDLWSFHFNSEEDAYRFVETLNSRTTPYIFGADLGTKFKNSQNDEDEKIKGEFGSLSTGKITDTVFEEYETGFEENEEGFIVHVPFQFVPQQSILEEIDVIFKSSNKVMVDDVMRNMTTKQKIELMMKKDPSIAKHIKENLPGNFNRFIQHNININYDKENDMAESIWKFPGHRRIFQCTNCYLIFVAKTRVRLRFDGVRPYVEVNIVPEKIVFNWAVVGKTNSKVIKEEGLLMSLRHHFTQQTILESFEIPFLVQFSMEMGLYAAFDINLPKKYMYYKDVKVIEYCGRLAIDKSTPPIVINFPDYHPLPHVGVGKKSTPGIEAVLGAEVYLKGKFFKLNTFKVGFEVETFSNPKTSLLSFRVRSI